MLSLPFLDDTKIEIRQKKLVLRRMEVYVQIFLPVMILILSEERKTVFATAILGLEMRCNQQRFN
jgi:hypothetical protein